MAFQEVAIVKLFLVNNMKDTRLSFNLGNNLIKRPPYARLAFLALKHKLKIRPPKQFKQSIKFAKHNN